MSQIKELYLNWELTSRVICPLVKHSSRLLVCHLVVCITCVKSVAGISSQGCQDDIPNLERSEVGTVLDATHGVTSSGYLCVVCGGYIKDGSRCQTQGRITNMEGGEVGTALRWYQ